MNDNNDLVRTHFFLNPYVRGLVSSKSILFTDF